MTVAVGTSFAGKTMRIPLKRKMGWHLSLQNGPSSWPSLLRALVHNMAGVHFWTVLECSTLPVATAHATTRRTPAAQTKPAQCDVPSGAVAPPSSRRRAPGALPLQPLQTELTVCSVLPSGEPKEGGGFRRTGVAESLGAFFFFNEPILTRHRVRHNFSQVPRMLGLHTSNDGFRQRALVAWHRRPPVSGS